MYIVYATVTFILFFFIYYIGCMGRLAADKLNKIKEVTFLEHYYKLNLKEINKPRLFFWISFIDGIIITLTSLVLFNFKTVLLAVIVGFFIMLFGLYLGYIVLFRFLINKKLLIKKKVVKKKS